MKKKEYLAPEMELVEVKLNSILMASGDDDDTTGGGGGGRF